MMVLYLFIQSPIKDKVKVMQQVLQELILLAVNTCVLVIASLDLDAKIGPLSRRIAGGIILYCNFLLSLLGPLLIITTIIMRLLAMRKRTKVQNESSVVVAVRPDIAEISADHQQRDAVREPHPIQMNNESTIQLVQTQLDQSELREHSSILPEAKHEIEFDQQIQGMSNQDRLRRQGNKKRAAWNFVQPIEEPSQLITSNLQKDQGNLKLDEKNACLK